MKITIINEDNGTKLTINNVSQEMIEQLKVNNVCVRCGATR